ncbi:MAG TPA: SpoIIE family protein phosphatase [Bacillota bacterium]
MDEPIYIDIGWTGLSKEGEELCGDNVEIVRTPEAVVAVLADGLGSGVKANILSKMTAKIIATMFEKGAQLEEIVETVSNTLPVCQKRRIAYSTFTIVQVNRDGETYIVEFDNPGVIYLHKGQIFGTRTKEIEIYGKKMKESRFRLVPGDILTVVSDGVVHAGIGGVLNLGWQWENVAEYLQREAAVEPSAVSLSRCLSNACERLYAGKPGDDATVLVLGVRNLKTLTVAVGPPENRGDDPLLVRMIQEERGSKVVCGGTTSTIVARGLGQRIEVELEQMDPVIPPRGRIPGIDLVTEGIITLSKTLEYLKTVHSPEEIPRADNGATSLAKALFESDRIRFLVGRAINPAHQNPNLPINLGLKIQAVNELAEILRRSGKQVEIHYF